MSEISIMDIEISKNEDSTFKVWFVAIAGEQGPIINMPGSLMRKLNTRIAEILLDKPNESTTKWQCSTCEHKFTSDELIPTCPECQATNDDILGLD